MRQHKGRPPFVTQATGIGMVGVDPNGQLISIPIVPSGGTGGSGTLPGNIASKEYVDALIAALQTQIDAGASFYMSPLTTGGDPTTAELIFAPDGDVVMLPVAF